MSCSPQGLGDDDYARLKLGNTILEMNAENKTTLNKVVPNDRRQRKYKEHRETQILLIVILVFP